MGSLLRLIGRHRHQDGQGSKRGRVLRGAGADVQGLLQADGHQQGWPAGQERPPGTSLAHPTPQVTSPTTVHLPDSPWQTRGLPPSPAQISLVLRLNLLPLPARCAFRAFFSLLLQLLFSTRGRSTLCWMNWKEPSTSFLPHPATQHLTPVPLLNWWLMIPTRRETSCVHIWVVEVDVPVSVQDGNVVAQSSCIELRVLEKPDNSVLLVLRCLWGVEATGIVLANTDLQELILLDILELVGSGDNLPCASSIVVAAVIGNYSTAADEVVVLVENEAGPGELTWARLAMLEATSWCWEVPCSALLA